MALAERILAGSLMRNLLLRNCVTYSNVIPSVLATENEISQGLSISAAVFHDAA